MLSRDKFSPRQWGRYTRIIAALATGSVSFICLLIILMSGMGEPKGSVGWLSFAIVGLSLSLLQMGQENKGYRDRLTPAIFILTILMSRLTVPSSEPKSRTRPSAGLPTPTTSPSRRTSMFYTSGPTAAGSCPAMARTTPWTSARRSAASLSTIYTGIGPCGVSDSQGQHPVLLA